LSFIEKEIKRLTGKAIHNLGMIRDGDHVMVAVSGGKDSLALLWLLKERINRVPIDYRITAVHVDPGFGAKSCDQMESPMALILGLLKAIWGRRPMGLKIVKTHAFSAPV
jgi:tRNA 2-thiocytidine biosynthesis protein TtcA